MASPLSSVISVNYLTCLEIDTAGTNFLRKGTGRTAHLCDDISAMLPSLRRLRCRMASVCQHMLDAAGKGTLHRLEHVVINLSLSEISESDTSYRYPRRCEAIPGDTFARLKADIEDHAGKLMHAMENARLVRILSHTFPGLEMRSLDVLTGRQMILAPASPWDADGEEVEERTVTQELFDSDSDSDSEEYTL